MDFETIDLDSLSSDLVAPQEVSNSGLNIRTVPEGNYVVEVDKMKLRKQPADARFNPGRTSANFVLNTEVGRKLFMDVSWEPSDNDSGIDGQNRLYSQLEQALDMFGQPVKDVLTAASEEERTFQVEVIEHARVAVGDLPEEHQTYYLETKGLGEMSMVTFYIKPEDDDARNHLYATGAKVRNTIRKLTVNS